MLPPPMMADIACFARMPLRRYAQRAVIFRRRQCALLPAYERDATFTPLLRLFATPLTRAAYGHDAALITLRLYVMLSGAMRSDGHMATPRYDAARYHDFASMITRDLCRERYAARCRYY